jgi:hypothetical protein
MTTPTARTQTARTKFHRFLDWWKDAPLYKTIWFFPFVMALYFAAVIKNFLTGDKK